MPVKYDQDARPDEKLLKLFILLLFNDREFSLTALTEKVNCSKQTIARLLKRIEENYPCHLEERKSGRQKFYSIQRPKISLKTTIDPEGLRQLALCRDLVRGLLPKEDWELANLSSQQAKTNLPRASYENYQDVSVGVSLVKGYIDYESKKTQLNALERCILNYRCCELHYQKEIGQESKVYYFAPQKLISYHGALYVWGWIVTPFSTVKALKERPINFSVHRITDVIVQDRSSKNLPVEEPNDLLDFGFMTEPTFKTKIYFDKEVKTYICDRIWSEDQKITPQDDGGIILEMTVSSKNELIAFILSFDYKAKVLEPTTVADEIKQRLEKTLRNY